MIEYDGKPIPSSILLILLVSFFSIFSGIYLMGSSPKNISDSRIIERNGVVENISCQKTTKGSKKRLSINNGSDQAFRVYMEGNCETLIPLFENKHFTLYGYHFLSGFKTLEVHVDDETVVTFDDNKFVINLSIFAFLVLCPLLASIGSVRGFLKGNYLLPIRKE